VSRVALRVANTTSIVIVGALCLAFGSISHRFKAKRNAETETEKKLYEEREKERGNLEAFSSFVTNIRRLFLSQNQATDENATQRRN
jgi:hypothetical protein